MKKWNQAWQETKSSRKRKMIEIKQTSTLIHLLWKQTKPVQKTKWFIYKPSSWEQTDVEGGAERRRKEEKRQWKSSLICAFVSSLIRFWVFMSTKSWIFYLCWKLKVSQCLDSSKYNRFSLQYLLIRTKRQAFRTTEICSPEEKLWYLRPPTRLPAPNSKERKKHSPFQLFKMFWVPFFQACCGGNL